MTLRDGWWPLDNEDEYDEMWPVPVLSDDFVRGLALAAASARSQDRLTG